MKEGTEGEERGPWRGARPTSDKPREEFSKESSVVSCAERGRDGQLSEPPMEPRMLGVGWGRHKRGIGDRGIISGGQHSSALREHWLS